MIYVNNNGDEIVTIIHRPTPAAVDEELEEILKLAAKINRRRVVWVTTGNNDGVGDIFKANEKDDLYKTFARNYPGDVVIQLLWQGTEQRLKEMQAGFAVPPASFSSSLSAVGPLLIDNPYGQAYVYTQEISFSVGIDIIIWDVKAPVSLVDDSVSYIDDAWYTIITNIVGNYSSDRLTTLCNFYLYDDYVEPIPPGQYEYDPTTGTGEGGFSNPVPPKKFNEFFNAVKSRGHEFAFPAEGDVDVSEDLYFYTVSRAEMLSRYAPYAPTFPFATEDISLPVGNIPPYKINVSAPSVKSDNFQTYFKYGNKNISSERIAEIYDPSSGFRKILV
jgi:hypothetical protein